MSLTSLHIVGVGLESSSIFSLQEITQRSPGCRWMDGLWATKSEGVGILSPQLGVYVELFPSIYVITIHRRYKRTDRQTTCDRKIALCGKTCTKPYRSIAEMAMRSLSAAAAAWRDADRRQRRIAWQLLSGMTMIVAWSRTSCDDCGDT